jgi:pimeloyl-ACP methyl ester carboxylesterase
MMQRVRNLGAIALSLLLSGSLELPQAQAQGEAQTPPGFASATAKVNGTVLHYVRGGKGPPVTLLHGFPQDWSEYRAIMPRLSQRFTVVSVDLRGIGGSAAAAGGYDAANMAEDVRRLAEVLKLERPYVVGHDLGGIVTYAYLRKYPQTLRGAMILDAPIPGIAGWDEAIGGSGVWHVGFMQVPGLGEKLVPGRQADYLGYFYDMGKFTAAERAYHLRSYASRAQLHAAFEMYRALPDNARFNAAQTAPNDVPLVFATGDKSPFASLVPKFAEGLRASGLSRVETATIPGSVHYLVADQPEAVVALIERHAGDPAHNK